MSEVTWKGNTIITAAQGVWTCKRGTFKPRMPVQELPRAMGVLGKHLGLAGATHTLAVVFLDVPTEDVDDVFTSLETLQVPANGNVTTGTLVVKDPTGATLHSLPHCMFLDAEPDEQALRAHLTAADLNGTDNPVWELPFTLTFLQTRR